MSDATDMKIVIRHKAGSKSNQVEEFPVQSREHLTFGRDIKSDVSFDASKDDLVSRNHARISITPGEVPTFRIADMGSSNGTFLNGKKLEAETEILPEDVIELGKDGPKLAFDIYPRPKAMQSRTRVFQAIDSSATRVIDIADAAKAAVAAEGNAAAKKSTALTTVAKSGVGKETVQLMLSTERKNTNRFWIAAVAGILLFLGIGGGAMYWRQKLEVDNLRLQQAQDVDLLRTQNAAAQQAAAGQLASQLGVTPQEIAQKYGNSTAQISMRWRLYDVTSGKPIFHKVVRCRNNTLAPGYVRMKDGTVVRWLTLEDEERKNIPIFGAGTGSGFVVSENGFLLTNKHVVSAWSYANSDAGYGAGIVFDVDNLNAFRCANAQAMAVNDGSEIANTINRWVPETGGWLFEFDSTKPLLTRISAMVGRNDYLEVRFAGSKLSINATIVRTSNDADAALIKIDSPQALSKLDIAADDQLTVGERTMVLGYPGISQRTFVLSAVNEMGNTRNEVQIIPQPTITEGIISQIAPPQKSGEVRVYSTMGEAFQLAINTTGSGNSGGPIFNSKGKVIGLFTYSSSDGRTTVTFGIPIKFGRELLQPQRQ